MHSCKENTRIVVRTQSRNESSGVPVEFKGRSDTEAVGVEAHNRLESPTSAADAEVTVLVITWHTNDPTPRRGLRLHRPLLSPSPSIYFFNSLHAVLVREHGYQGKQMLTRSVHYSRVARKA